MQTPMTSCHLISTWHEWNTNTDDVMMMWFTLYVNLGTSCLACVMHVHMHAHVLYVNLVHLSNQVAWHAYKLAQT